MCALEQAIAGSDIVVAPQELQCLTVPYLWAKRRRICKSWIWWGHGYNFQASVPLLSCDQNERGHQTLPDKTGRRVDHVYRGGADYWRKQGLPEGRVIPYYNTIDVEGLRKAGQRSAKDRYGTSHKLGIARKAGSACSQAVCMRKKSGLSLEGICLLKKSYPDVGLLIIGDGEERETWNDRLSNLAPRCAFLGRDCGSKDTAAYFSLADLMVIPGLVGLAIVHGFAFACH